MINFLDSFFRSISNFISREILDYIKHNPLSFWSISLYVIVIFSICYFIYLEIKRKTFTVFFSEKTSFFGRILKPVLIFIFCFLALLLVSNIIYRCN